MKVRWLPGWKNTDVLTNDDEIVQAGWQQSRRKRPKSEIDLDNSIQNPLKMEFLVPLPDGGAFFFLINHTPGPHLGLP